MLFILHVCAFFFSSLFTFHGIDHRAHRSFLWEQWIKPLLTDFAVKTQTHSHAHDKRNMPKIITFERWNWLLYGLANTLHLRDSRLENVEIRFLVKTPNISERNPKYMWRRRRAFCCSLLMFFLSPWHLIGRFRASILFLATIFQWILHKLLNMCENWTQPHIHSHTHRIAWLFRLT